MGFHNVLFVDDERISLNAIQRTVQHEPYRSLFAVSGSQAMEVIRSEPVHLVVTDLLMPQMDGFQLLEWIQANCPDIVRVIVSGVSDTDSLLEAINRKSVYRYMVKPWNSEDFKIVVRQSLEFHDIQEDRKRLIAELEKANQDLHETVRYRTNQVLALYNHAEIGKYAAQIVHNLNNPLMAIFGALSMSKMAMDQTPPDLVMLSRVHEILSKSADNLKNIIRTVLLHARDRHHDKNGPVELHRVIYDEMELFNFNALFRSRIQKQLDLQPSLPPVFGNILQIKQILDNLIKNAIDAMEEAADKKLTIATRHEEGWVKITIADTGCGIDPKHLDDIFQPDFSTKPLDKGTGLGLASVRSMVSAYQGRVSVASIPGRGTTFTIRLPAYRTE